MTNRALFWLPKLFVLAGALFIVVPCAAHLPASIEPLFPGVAYAATDEASPPALVMDETHVVVAPTSEAAPIVPALAPAAPPAPAAAPIATGIPTDPGAVLAVLISAVQEKNWPLAAGLLVLALVLFLRTVGARIHHWFESRRAAVVLACVAAAAGAIVTPLLAGVPWTWTLLGQAMTAALAAMGAVAGVRALRKGGTSMRHVENQFMRRAKKDAKTTKALEKKDPPKPPSSSSLPGGGTLGSILSVLLLVVGLASPAAAQTYVRPSKGTPITLFTDDTTPAAFTSTLYDWSAFDGVEITAQVALEGGVSSFDDCSQAPTFLISEFATKTGTGYSINPNNGTVKINAAATSGLVNSFTYRAKVAAPYIKIKTGTNSAGGIGAIACSWSLYATPLPFVDTVQLLEAGSTTSTFSASITDGAAGVALVYGGATMLGRTLYVENTGIALAYCQVVNTATAVSATSYGFTLAAATVANDGTGGKISFPVPLHNVRCITAAGLTTTLKGFVQ